MVFVSLWGGASSYSSPPSRDHNDKSCDSFTLISSVHIVFQDTVKTLVAVHNLQMDSCKQLPDVLLSSTIVLEGKPGQLLTVSGLYFWNEVVFWLLWQVHTSEPAR